MCLVSKTFKSLKSGFSHFAAKAGERRVRKEFARRREDENVRYRQEIKDKHLYHVRALEDLNAAERQALIKVRQSWRNR